jgi:hypothetical protein
LPFSNEAFAAEPGAAVNLTGMSTTDVLADPLSEALALLLTVPLIEIYAVLWRVGVLEILVSDRASSRQPSAALARMYAYQLRSA